MSGEPRLWRFGSAVLRAPDRRRMIVAAVLLMVIAATVLPALTAGRHGVAPWQLLALLRQPAESFELWVLWYARLPRLLVALGAGAALGAAGAVFQSLTRNPLGSPDIIGRNAGAAAGAVAVTLIWPGVLPVPAGALLGAGVVVLGIYLAAGRRFRLTADVIIAGIALNAMAIAFVQFAIADVRTKQAQTVAAWLSGSLAARDWLDVLGIMALTVPVVTALIALSRRIALFDLGDDLPTALGVPVTPTQWASVMLATVLAVGAVLVSGPVAFVALAAPHIARRLAAGQSPPVLLSALAGGAVLALANATVLALPGATRLPVGVLTAAFGGVYLIGLLLNEIRRPGRQ